MVMNTTGGLGVALVAVWWRRNIDMGGEAVTLVTDFNSFSWAFGIAVEKHFSKNLNFFFVLK